MKNFAHFALPALLSLAAIASFVSCGEKPVPDPAPYPYIQHEIEYMGLREGLTQSSTNKEFDDALAVVMQQWVDSHPGHGSIPYIVDGITYYFANSAAITDGIPAEIWDIFAHAIEGRDHPVGSCWSLDYYHIPAAATTGTVYLIRTIVTDASREIGVRFVATRADLQPI
jgi:hypothetical protein